jgi:hypothetical protein
MQHSGIVRLEDDATSMCRMVIRELTNCINYNDRERVRYFSYPAKLDLKEFDIIKCKDWTQLASRLNKVTQSVEIREGNYSSSTVGILLRNNNDVDLKYFL